MRKFIFICILPILSFATDFKELLFNGNCTTCHFINKSVSAPSMKNVQQVYKTAFPNKQDFIEYMSQWAEHPNPKGSLMHNAITKYGLMPELGFEREVLKEIVEYIYDLQ